MKRIFSALLLSLCANLAANEISTWSSPPEVISTSGIDASNPHVKMDTDGNSVAIWLEGDVVVSKSLPFGGAWSSATTLSSTGASNLHLVMDGAGNTTALWLESGLVKTATMPSGSAWGSATTLSASGSSSPKISVDSAGNLVAIWVTASDINTKTQLFGGSWSSVSTLTSDAHSDSPAVSIGEDGTVAALWHTFNTITSIDNIHSATMTLGGSWSSSSLVSNPAVPSVNPVVAVDQSGTAIGAWFSYIPSGLNFTNVYVTAAKLPLSGSWSGSLFVSDAGVRDPSQLFIRIMIGSSDDTAMLIWSQCYDGINFSLESAVTDNKINVAPRTLINRSLYSFSADIASNITNEVEAVYMFFDGSSTVINSVESTLESFANEFWTNPVTISDGTSNAYPKIATGITGGTNCNATALWVGYDGVNSNISSSLGSGVLVTPPTSVAVVQNLNNFGSFQEYYDTITWTDSAAPNVVGYVVYLNGVQLAFVNPGDQQFINHNRIQNQPAVYGVATYDDTGTQSSIITVTFP